MTAPRARQGTSPIAAPLKIAPRFDAKPWGGRRLAQLGKQLPPGLIGESLESSTDAVVIGGPYDGVTLGEIVERCAPALLGARGVTASGVLRDFPLLIKFIDANQNLSIQVHPDDASAPPGKRGKTEAWLIIAAEPGARIVIGVDGKLDVERVAELIVETPVQAGDVFAIPAGTIHAIGAGVLLYEIQQASDVTYRIYDWGRDREMHVEQAMAVARPSQQAQRTTPVQMDDGRELLVASPYFALERWRIADRTVLPESPESFRVMTVIDGEVALSGVASATGDTVVLPADLPEVIVDGNAVALVGYIPDLSTDIVAPLRERGFDDFAIRALGLEL